jgi:excisionase family DNA binding protein
VREKVSREALDARLLLTIEEAAELCGIDRATAYRRLVRTNEWPVIRIGRVARVPAPWLREWLQTRTRSALENAESSAPSTRRALRRSASYAPRRAKV